MSTAGMVVFGLMGLWLTLRVFRGIVTGEMRLFFWHFKREGGERRFWCWMTGGALLSLALYFAALKCYLGPLRF